MRIAFIANKCPPVHVKTLEVRPLGGKETALIRVTEILNAHDHDVTVLTTYKIHRRRNRSIAI